ncbi:MAG: universal stress protein [Desulfobacterales bacterium]|jgi:nucleotide-binding universal stress UspA family protein|nr:universal stress protein [Desulfobacterales bacterium]MCU0562099.1 universal stress protein [Desulfobacterales bacterium]
MQKKILVAVDNSPHSRGAIDYAVQMNQLIPELGFTLFHVQPPVSQFLLDEAKHDAKAQVELRKIAARNAEASDRLLGGLKEVMLRTGVPEASVELMAQPRRQGVAKDILDLAQSNLFDAILVGRRGIGGLQKLFMGSVSAHLVENSPLIPVWMVDGKVFSSRVMAAVDGSESSLRAVDHLAFILSGVPEARVCFFHVSPRLKDFCEIDFSQDQSDELEALITRGDRRCMDDFFSAALAKLRAAGFDASQIETRTAATLVSIGETILKAAREGGFGTLVMGRRGVNKSFFGGKTSFLVSRDISDAALWMVP